MNRFKDKTAVAVITCNREDFFKKSIASIDRNAVGKILVVNNGEQYSSYPDGIEVAQSFRNPTPVGIGKNVALRQLKMAGYDYIFLMEDDVIIKDNKVFEKYIETAADSGLWAGQLSYGTHGGIGGGNVKPDGTPDKRAVAQYTKTKVDLYKNSLHAFVLYHANTLKHIGYMDERYINAAEHLDHYQQAFKKGLGSYYWYFPDIHNSFDYLEDIDENHTGSTIRNGSTFKKDFEYSWQLFKEKYKLFPHEMPEVVSEVMMDKLALIEKNYSLKNLL